MNALATIGIALFILLPKHGLIDFSLMPLLFLGLKAVFRGRPIVIWNYKVICVSLLLVALALLSNYINVLPITDVSLRTVRLLLLVLLLAMVRSSMESFEVNDVFRCIVVAALINGLVVYVQLATHDHYSFIDLSLNFDSSRDTPHRKPGLLSGFPTAGILNLLGFLSLISIGRSSKFFWPCLLFLAPIFLLTSRTALFLALSSILILSLFRPRLRISALAAMSVLLALSIFLLGSNLRVDLGYKLVFAFEPFFNFLDGNGFYSNSTNSLLTKHYSFPNDVGTLLWGDGSYGGSDVYFIRMIWSAGLIFLSVSLIFFVHLWSSSVRAQVNFQTKLIVWLMFFVVFIASFIGSYIFSRVVSDCLLLIWASSYRFRTKRIHRLGREHGFGT